MSYRDPPWIPVKDEATRKALDEIRRSLMELARDLRFLDLVIVLPNAANVVVRPGLGRALLGYALGAPTGAVSAGYVTEIARTMDTITFQANGYGATISLPIRFW